MPFWNDPATLFPKQAHRWVIDFGTSEIGQALNADKKNPFKKTIEANKITRFFAKSCDKPSYEIGIQEAKYLYSHTFKFPKRVSWKPITIVFYDTIVRTNNIQTFEQNIQNNIRVDLQKPPSGSKDTFKPAPIGNRFQGAGPFLPQESLTPIKKDPVAVQTQTPLASNLLTTKTYIDGTSLKNQYLDKDNEKGTYTSNSTQLFFYQYLQSIGYVFPKSETEQSSAVFRTFNFKDQTKTAINTIVIQEIDELSQNTEAWILNNPIISNVSFDKLDYAAEDILKITITVHYDWAELKTRNIATSDYALNTTPEGIVSKYNFVEVPPEITVQAGNNERTATIQEITAIDVPAGAATKPTASTTELRATPSTPAVPPPAPAPAPVAASQLPEPPPLE